MQEKELVDQIIRPLLNESGMELFCLRLNVYQGTVNIELLIDHPQGGVSLDECARINRDLCGIIDEQEIYNGDYTMSVSSPGLDWPLSSVKDYRRLTGHDLTVFYQAEEGGNVTAYQGTIQAADDQAVVLMTKEGEARLLLQYIQKAEVKI